MTGDPFRWDLERKLFRALVEMTRANHGRGAVQSQPDAFTPSSIRRRAGVNNLARTRNGQAWFELISVHEVVEDVNHPDRTLFRLTAKGRALGDALFPAVTPTTAAPMDYMAEAALRADPEGRQ